MESIWTLVTILGPILLVAAIVWAFARNRAAGRASVEQAERGAARLREQLEREDEARER